MAQSDGYRRGNLREVLVRRAVVALRDAGADALSLRELARDIGVSHAAPARHFPDRASLLDAVAVEGFAALGARLEEAASPGPSAAQRVRRTADAYLDFALGEPNLAEVMFRHDDGRDASVGAGATAAFTPIVALFEELAAPVSATATTDAATTATLFLAALQGIAGLVACGAVPAASVPHLLDDAVPRFVAP